MELSRKDVLHLSALCRMNLSEDEIERFRGQLSNILDNFEILRQVDTTDVPPTAYPLPLSNVTREDEVRPSCSQEEILANAPRRENGQFRVRAVLE